MLLVVSAAAIANGCAIYDPSLLPIAQNVDASQDDEPAEGGGDAGQIPTPEADADTLGAGDGDIDADATVMADVTKAELDASDSGNELPDVKDVSTEAMIDARADADSGVLGSSTCDAACMTQCANGVMDGDETGVDCGGACPATGRACPSPSLRNLVVNDTSLGNDGIANNTLWSLQPSFAPGLTAYGDRTYTIGLLSAPAQHLRGKPWIRPANDSKFYAATSPPLATVMATGTYLFLGLDVRHDTAALSSAGFTNQNYSFVLNEGNVPQTYNIWRRPITTANQTLPTFSDAVASLYLVIVE